jgi:hypothetical protein
VNRLSFSEYNGEPLVCSVVIVGIGIVLHPHKFNGRDKPVCLQGSEVRAEVVPVKSRAINSYDE